MLSSEVVAHFLTIHFEMIHLSMTTGEHKPKQQTVEHALEIKQLTLLMMAYLEYCLDAIHLLDTPNWCALKCLWGTIG